jgi:DNA polymerase III epsilon subunit family exonuclease
VTDLRTSGPQGPAGPAGPAWAAAAPVPAAGPGSGAPFAPPAVRHIPAVPGTARGADTPAGLETPPAREVADGRPLTSLPLTSLPLTSLPLTSLPLTQIEFAVVDVETTGWSPAEARITEIAAVKLRGGQVTGEFSTLVDPGMPVPADIEALTGISSQMVSAAPGPADVLPAWLGFARGCVLAAHNAPFDLGFLTAACDACGLAWPGFAVLDTVAVARQVLVEGEAPDCKLATLAAFFGAAELPRHRALADARATAAVLDVLITRLALLGICTFDDLGEWLAVP